jgi:hypothetical protein
VAAAAAAASGGQSHSLGKAGASSCECAREAGRGHAQVESSQRWLVDSLSVGWAAVPALPTVHKLDDPQRPHSHGGGGFSRESVFISVGRSAAWAAWAAWAASAAAFSEYLSVRYVRPEC